MDWTTVDPALTPAFLSELRDSGRREQYLGDCEFQLQLSKAALKSLFSECEPCVASRFGLNLWIKHRKYMGTMLIQVNGSLTVFGLMLMIYDDLTGYGHEVTLRSMRLCTEHEVLDPTKLLMDYELTEHSCVLCLLLSS